MRLAKRAGDPFLLWTLGADMAWLFERMIELAAWVAFILGLICLVESVRLLVQWFRSLSDNPMPELLMQAGQSAGCFVIMALAMGGLACIDRYVFDAPEQPSASK